MSSRFNKKIVALPASEGGAAAVEFGLLAPVLIIIIVGLVDYGMAMFDKMQLRSAARAGTQHAMGYSGILSLTSSVQTAIKQAVVDATELGSTSKIITSDVTITCSCRDTSVEPSGTNADLTSVTCGSGSCASGETSFVNVSVAQSYNLLLGGTTLNLVGDATVRIQ